MKHKLLIAIVLLGYTSTNAQISENKDSLVTAERDSLDRVKILDKILIEEKRNTLKAEDFLDEMPSFHGGIAALYKFLSSNVEYPAECAEKNIQGKVIVRFTVFKDGSVGDVGLSKSVDPLLDAEAMRVVKLMPNWNPGMLDGQPVNVWYELPISFVLPENTSVLDSTVTASPEKHIIQ